VTDLPESGGMSGPAPGESELEIPAGQVYDWYARARVMHDGGDPVGAVELLLWAVAAEPEARSLREALARAQFDAHRFADSAESFGIIVAEDPADHYAQFGLGLASMRTADLDTAVAHLAIAVALRPDLPHYEKALRSARAAVVRRANPIPGEEHE
jgi:tetratricopeptide (TPR) repeat protein